MKDRFSIHTINRDSIESLVAVFQECLPDRSFGHGISRFNPLLKIINELHDLSACCAVEQSFVQDPDFLAEHEVYYSKWTAPIPRYCTRLHFFSEPPISDDLIESIDQMFETPDAYLGFVTLRPIGISPIGATIIRPAAKGGSMYLLSQDQFKVNIAGRSFHVCGTPFMQQDNAVGACAQASIWMALRTLRRKEGQAAFSPAQITTAATRFLVMRRTLPNRGGLSLEQVSEAIRGAGYAPHMIPLRPFDADATPEMLAKMKRALYPYVESGIPVLLLLFPSKSEGHAVVLIGHSWNASPENLIKLKTLEFGDTTTEVEIFDAASWVSPFIIHNDNTGPYIPLHDSPGGEGFYCLAHAGYALPLLQTDVFVDGSEAQECAIRFLEDSLLNVAPALCGAGQGSVSCSKLVMRTYLQDRSDFRRNVVEGDFSPDVKNYYRLKWLPKRIWVTELNLMDGYGANPGSGQLRIGEILLDPAAEPEEGAFLSIRLAGCLIPDNQTGITGIVIDRDAISGNIEIMPVSGDSSTPLIRPSV